jgi:hypothetical protein
MASTASAGRGFGKIFNELVSSVKGAAIALKFLMNLL